MSERFDCFPYRLIWEFFCNFMGISLDMSWRHGVWIAVFATHAFDFSRKSQADEHPRDGDAAFPRAVHAWEMRNGTEDDPSPTMVTDRLMK